jgi:hypothetical protein
MKLEQVYVASNGDIIIQYDAESMYKMQPKEDVEAVIAEAMDALKDGAVEFATIMHGFEPVEFLNYYDRDGKLIGTAGTHIFDQYSEMNNLFYLRRISSGTKSEALQTETLMASGALISLSQWAEDHGIDPATARQRAGRGAFRTARKIGRNWVIEADEELIDHRRK